MNLRDRSSLSMPRSSATGVSPLVPWFSLYGVSHGTPSRFGRGGRCRRCSSISPRPWNTIEPSSLAKVVLLILGPRATKYTQIFSWKYFFPLLDSVFFPSYRDCEMEFRASAYLCPRYFFFHIDPINLIEFEEILCTYLFCIIKIISV